MNSINKPASISIPISDQSIRELHVGDTVLLNGVMLTGRDTAHKWLYEHFIGRTVAATAKDKIVYQELESLLQGSLIYHCGPLVSGLDTGKYQFISTGPTTSLREEACQAEIMRHFNLKGVIGKGGMGDKTLQACIQTPALYFHAVGGAGALSASSVEQVLGVYKLEFGVPEAMWVIKVKEFPVVVTMDAYGESLHKQVLETSHAVLEGLIG